MFDKLLEVGSTLDWISPLLAWILDITRWPSYTFVIPQGHDMVGQGWTEADIRHVLKQRGVQVWGEMIVNGNTMFTVRKRDKATVEQILESTKTRKPPRRSLWARLF